MAVKTIGNKYFGILKGDAIKIQVNFQKQRRKLSEDIQKRSPFYSL